MQETSNISPIDTELEPAPYQSQNQLPYLKSRAALLPTFAEMVTTVSLQCHYSTSTSAGKRS